AATSTAKMSMSMGGNCKISMLWNWYTIDSCFLSSSWHVTTHGMFAGSCIGVILLVMALEFFRRFAKEYERYILRAHLAAHPPATSSSVSSSGPNASTAKAPGMRSALLNTAAPPSFRPSLIQQVIRAGLHMVQFAIAYFVMLLAMYFNGYIIICIFIGAFLGYFVFSWETIELGGDGVKEEVTVCCG
ncbi:ctr copper transporter, partial [Mytilinidion resinicola]